jgi:hypothetical protein
VLLWLLCNGEYLVAGWSFYGVRDTDEIGGREVPGEEGRYSSEKRKDGVENVNVAAFTIFRTERCGIFRAEFSDLFVSRRIANGMRVGTLMHKHHSELALCFKDGSIFFLITVNSESPTTFAGTWRRSQGCFIEPDGVIVNSRGVAKASRAMVGCLEALFSSHTPRFMILQLGILSHLKLQYRYSCSAAI